MMDNKERDEAFEAYWSEFNNIDVLKNLAREIWNDAFIAGGKKPWFSLTREQMKAIKNMEFEE
jgi:hypothetical protein